MNELQSSTCSFDQVIFQQFLHFLSEAWLLKIHLATHGFRDTNLSHTFKNAIQPVYSIRIYFLYLFVFACLFLSPFLSQSSSCKWCTKAYSDGTPFLQGKRSCYGCVSTEYLCSPSLDILYSCNSFQYDSTVSSQNLSASCLDENNVRRTSQITIPIGNSNGVLILGGTGFTRTCSSVQVSASNAAVTLSATCGTVGPHSRASTLELSSFVANVNGQLTFTGKLSNGMPSQQSGTSICSLGTSCGAGYMRRPDGSCMSCSTKGFEAAPGQYCDGFNVGSLLCPAGSYCLGGDSQPTTCNGTCFCDHGSTSACPPCPAGRLCAGGALSGYCQVGHFCQNSVVIPCPSGTYGDEFMLTNADCSGKCDSLWTNSAGSIACYNLSDGGIVLITFIVVFCTVGFLTASACAHRWIKFPMPFLRNGSEVDASVNDPATQASRSAKQMQIRDGVAVLVAKVNNHIFTSAPNMMAKMSQEGRVDADHVNSLIVRARQRFTEHLSSALLAHSRLQFDDQTYSRYLPLWAKRTEGKLQGEVELNIAAEALFTSLASDVEKDILSYFQKLNAENLQQPQAQSQLSQQEHSVEHLVQAQIEQQLPLSSPLRIDGSFPPWEWATVDCDLDMKLSKAFPLPYNSTFLALLRSRYGPSISTSEVWDCLYTAFDFLTIIACIVCMAGGTLFEILFSMQNDINKHALFTFFSDADAIGFRVSWYAASNVAHPYLYYDDLSEQEGKHMFEPVLGQCTSVVGPIYFTLHVIVFICFCFVIVGQLTNAYNRYLKPTVRRSCLDGKRRLEAAIRSVALCALIIAIVVYRAGCIARVSRLPKMTRQSWGAPGIYQLLPPPMVHLNVTFSFKASSFTFSIVALVCTFFTTFWSFQKIHPASLRSAPVIAQQPKPNSNQEVHAQRIAAGDASYSGAVPRPPLSDSRDYMALPDAPVDSAAHFNPLQFPHALSHGSAPPGGVPSPPFGDSQAVRYHADPQNVYMRLAPEPGSMHNDNEGLEIEMQLLGDEPGQAQSVALGNASMIVRAHRVQ